MIPNFVHFKRYVSEHNFLSYFLHIHPDCTMLWTFIFQYYVKVIHKVTVFIRSARSSGVSHISLRSGSVRL